MKLGIYNLQLQFNEARLIEATRRWIALIANISVDTLPDTIGTSSGNEVVAAGSMTKLTVDTQIATDNIQKRIDTLSEHRVVRASIKRWIKDDHYHFQPAVYWHKLDNTLWCGIQNYIDSQADLSKKLLKRPEILEYLSDVTLPSTPGYEIQHISSSTDVDHFLKVADNQQRRHTLIVVSKETKSGKPTINLNELSKYAYGWATIYLLSEYLPNDQLSRMSARCKTTKDTGLFNGGIRVIYPPDKHGKPANPFNYAPKSIADYYRHGINPERTIAVGSFKNCDGKLAYDHRDPKEVENIRLSESDAINEKLAEEADRQREQSEKLADWAVEEASTQADEARQERHRRQNLESVVNAVAQPTATQVSPQTKALLLSNAAPYMHPELSLRLINALFPERIAFDSDNKSIESARNCSLHKSHWSEIFELLWKLANDYYAERFKGGDPRVIGENIFGNSGYAPIESSKTRQDPTLMRLREAKWRDKFFCCEEHLKLGSIRDPQHCARIHYAWIIDEGSSPVILIGHCGDHLPTK